MAKFTQEQLDQAKSLLENGKLLFQMKEDMGIEQEDVMTLKDEMIGAFGIDKIRPLIRAAIQSQNGSIGSFEKLPARVKKMDLKNIDKIDEMIANLQATIVELNIIKASL